MELKWERDGDRDVDLCDSFRLVGWVRRNADGYTTHVSVDLCRDILPCEKERYTSLRPAMRALKATVTVLLLGESYGA